MECCLPRLLPRRVDAISPVKSTTLLNITIRCPYQHCDLVWITFIPQRERPHEPSRFRLKVESFSALYRLPLAYRGGAFADRFYSKSHIRNYASAEDFKHAKKKGCRRVRMDVAKERHPFAIR